MCPFTSRTRKPTSFQSVGSSGQLCARVHVAEAESYRLRLLAEEEKFEKALWEFREVYTRIVRNCRSETRSRMEIGLQSASFVRLTV